MGRPHLLMPGRMMAHVIEQLEEEFTVHRLWEADDREALLEKVAPDIMAIATGAHAPVDGAMMSRFPSLRIISSFGVGYDTVDAAWAGEHGIYVTNTPDVLTEEVADTAMALLLMAARELGAAERHLRAGKWTERAYPLTTTTLRGRKLGIFGLGRIGKAIARRAEGFGLPIAYHNRSRATDVSYEYHDSLTGLAEAVDTLVAVVPGGDSTHHAVNAEVLKALGPDGIVVNIGRGTVIDEHALIEALENGTIRSAGLDVFEEEPKVPQALINMDRLALLPHVGSASEHTRKAMGQLVVDNLRNWKRTGIPITPVAETPIRG
ncbi:2-hydroxyacid dehydrogenase [Tepidamorphus sp. 3E244]|uniref:2-hydroxyacid dehydrogenase n=1 Tax=Tepidamorphus sp. 3E244 TaxID=3385498 RepID=UPI0038FC069C